MSGTDGVVSIAGAHAVLPAKAHLMDRRAFGFGSDVLIGITHAVHLAEGVTTCNKCDGLVIVHCHASERFAHVAG